ncbi:MAG: MEDS domain-containing protein, partial [Candidatus Bathyarchaeia archaeon]
MKAEYWRKESEVLDFVKGLQATDHVVLFYNDLKDCRQVLFTYLKAGMDKGEVGFYVAGGERPEQIQKATEEEFSRNIKRYEMIGALKIVNYDEWYIIDGRVNIPKIMGLWRKVVDEAKERGFKGVRACGEMSCFFRHNLANELLEYEKACNRRLKMPMTAVCAYDVNLVKPFGEKFFLDLLKAHSHVLFTEPEIGFNATLEAVDRVLEKAFGG